MEKITNVTELLSIAKNIRRDIIEETYNAKSGHPGGALSIADILTVLYFNEMNIDPKNPKMDGRDKFILSKGHASAAFYAALCERGFFEKDELIKFRKLGSMLQGHPDMKKIPGVEMSSGSLGQGLSVGCGMAIANKLKNQDGRVYVIVGDGEIEEGQIWEAAMSASQYKLDNLCVIVDYNNLQIDGKITEIMSSLPIDKKFESFGFDVLYVDGNDIKGLLEVFEKARKVKEKPVAIIAKTIKGKGVSFMEDKLEWHGKAPTEEEYKLAMEELQ